MGSCPAARSISIVKALLSQAPGRWEWGCSDLQLYKHRAEPQPWSFIPLCAPPCPALPCLWLWALPPHPRADSYRAQEGMQSQAPVTGSTSHSLIHLHRDQAEIHYSRLCIRPNKVKQTLPDRKNSPPPHLYLPTTVLCNPKLELGSEQPKSHELTWFPRVSGWIIYATVSHQQENTITKCKQRLKTPTIWITVQGAAGEEQECSVVSATPQTLPLPN